MQFPDDDNGQMLAAMADAGIDLTQELEVDFFLVFDDQRDAESALEALSQLASQDEVEMIYDEELTRWEVIVCVHMVPEYQSIADKEVELHQFAQEFDGISDGWGVMQNQDNDGEFADDEDHVHDHNCGDHCH